MSEIHFAKWLMRDTQPTVVRLESGSWHLPPHRLAKIHYLAESRPTKRAADKWQAGEFSNKVSRATCG